MSGEHDHGHSHDAPDRRAVRAEALEALLTEKGLLDPAAVDRIVRHYEEDIGPMNGARVVARAWVDADFRARLLENGTAAIGELGLSGAQTEHLVVVENSARVHNVVVCSLCSCYPWAVLGPPPAWYKSPEYRSRVVREPRTVLAEMGLGLDGAVEIRVWDSSAEVRYLVLPERPLGTEALPEPELADLVTRDCMIGVAVPRLPTRG